uniref:Uncharacterized protein n=1 Tax=Romanomermis culicivorax TaxID=13658 RepID=A0A915IST4_ROMCU
MRYGLGSKILYQIFFGIDVFVFETTSIFTAFVDEKVHKSLSQTHGLRRMVEISPFVPLINGFFLTGLHFFKSTYIFTIVVSFHRPSQEQPDGISYGLLIFQGITTTAGNQKTVQPFKHHP